MQELEEAKELIIKIEKELETLKRLNPYLVIDFEKELEKLIIEINKQDFMVQFLGVED